jgi:hypothetical protein
MLTFIRLATKFLRFFDNCFFTYFSFLTESAISYVYTIGIYGSSPTIQDGKDAAPIEAYRPLGKESGGVSF